MLNAGWWGLLQLRPYWEAARAAHPVPPLRAKLWKALQSNRHSRRCRPETRVQEDARAVAIGAGVRELCAEEPP
jgi:hypothetical protein